MASYQNIKRMPRKHYSEHELLYRFWLAEGISYTTFMMYFTLPKRFRVQVNTKRVMKWIIATRIFCEAPLQRPLIRVCLI